MIVMREKNEVSADLDKLKKDLERYKKNNETLAEEVKTLKSKKAEKESTDSQEFDNLEKENITLKSEIKELKLGLRLEKREVEKKSSLLTFVREKEAKNKEKIQELEKEK